MQKVMSRDCESRQTEGNLEHEIARPARNCDRRNIGVSPCRNENAQTKYYTDFRFDATMACVFTLDQLLKIQSEDADMIVTTIHVQPAA